MFIWMSVMKSLACNTGNNLGRPCRDLDELWVIALKSIKVILDEEGLVNKTYDIHSLAKRNYSRADLFLVRIDDSLKLLLCSLLNLFRLCRSGMLL